MQVIFIRHSKTAGNLERRYIGRTDEPLCAEGVELAEEVFKSGNLPNPDVVITSSLLRCTQTAKILFPAHEFEDCKELNECDFGIFEGKTAAELEGNAAYSAWLETDCLGDIPDGESIADFKNRCCAAFLKIMQKHSGKSSIALVIHGGSIMAILERFSIPKQDFYSYHLPNCGSVTRYYEGLRSQTFEKV